MSDTVGVIDVLETSVVGKSPELACEDVIVANDNFVAAIDGATEETGATYDGTTND